MFRLWFAWFLVLLTWIGGPCSSAEGSLTPMVINTWAVGGVPKATEAGWAALNKGSAVDAVEAIGSTCEALQCRGKVGWGGSPDEDGETTQDAMIMDGATHDVGAVGCLRRIKNAIGVARAVMNYTKETFLVGNSATQFALSVGFKEEDLHSDESRRMWKDWKENDCQPNYRQNVTPDPKTSCGPYKPNPSEPGHPAQTDRLVDECNHDTIGMMAIDRNGNIASGTSTNGLTFKVPGRVGDSPIAGAGSYADNEAGAASCTGNGDIMMRFLPSYQAVESMRLGADPRTAAKDAIARIVRFYPKFVGSIVTVNKTGSHGAACHGWSVGTWQYCVYNPQASHVQIVNVTCGGTS